MRRASLLLLTVCSLAAVAPPMVGMAQSRRQEEEDDARRKQQAEAEQRKKEKEKEWKMNPAPLPTVKNAGPCPYVKVLYDASRYAEFKDNKEAIGNVGYTGEIQGVAATCQYKSDEPIRMSMDVGFSLGRGPMAQSSSKSYKYWVAVTSRNQTVLAREEFEVQADFAAGADRVNVTERIDGITIPRAKATVAGDNFEVLVGFDVTPEMAEFNRLGKRFRANVVGPTASAN
jgi:hypothetical protein